MEANYDTAVGSSRMGRYLARVRFLSEAINIETVGRNGDFSRPQAELLKVTRAAGSDRTAPSAPLIPNDKSRNSQITTDYKNFTQPS